MQTLLNYMHMHVSWKYNLGDMGVSSELDYLEEWSPVYKIVIVLLLPVRTVISQVLNDKKHIGKLAC